MVAPCFSPNMAVINIPAIPACSLGPLHLQDEMVVAEPIQAVNGLLGIRA